jgi:peptidoglycan/LPS O-acetylase OafA/YrhL
MKAASKLGALTPPRSPEPGTGYLPTLDGWRAVAILGVMVCHACDALFHADGTYPNAFLHALTRHGALGVDIFFGISGFLICSRLLADNQRHGGISLKRFYIRRFFRILPPYLTYLGGLAVLAGFGLIAISPGVWWSCLLFYRNYLPSTGDGLFYTGHFWSLAVEEHFYLLWPGLLVVLGIPRARRAVVALAGAIALWRVWEYRHHGLAHWIPQAGFYTRTDIRLDGLLWGCWMALILNDPIWRERLTRWLSPVVWLALLAAFVGCVRYQPPLAMLWQALLIPILLAGTVLRPVTPAGRLLEWLPLRWIGRISYSLYLWNSLFFPGMANPRPLPLGVFQQLPWSILPVFACASLSYYLIERPLVRLGHTLSASVSSKDVGHPVPVSRPAQAA